MKTKSEESWLMNSLALLVESKICCAVLVPVTEYDVNLRDCRVLLADALTQFFGASKYMFYIVGFAGW